MARPQKDGLEYFPLNTDIDQDDKLQLIEAKFGITGFGIVIKLLMKIYREGYYYEWSEKEQLLFSRRVNVDINMVNDVINECLKWDLFNMDLYSTYGILTSRGIQRRYFEAVNRRKEVEVINQYCLIDLKKRANVVYVNINPVNVNNNPLSHTINADINPQSKVKESKVKDTITPPIPPDNKTDLADDFNPEEIEGGRGQVFEIFEQELGQPLSSFKAEQIDHWLKDFSPELIIQALKIAILNNNRSFKYIDGILLKWMAEGVKTVADAEERERKFQEQKRIRAGPANRKSTADQNAQVLEAVFGAEA